MFVRQKQKISIIQIFSQNTPELLDIGQKAIVLVMATFPIIGFQIVGIGYFQAIGKIKYSTFLSMLRQFLLLIPFLLILPLIFGLNGVWISGPASDFGAGVFTGIVLLREIKKIKHGMKEQEKV